MDSCFENPLHFESFFAAEGASAYLTPRLESSAFKILNQESPFTFNETTLTLKNHYDSEIEEVI